MDIHSCSYYCDKPPCIKRQRDELRDKLFDELEKAEEEKKKLEAIKVVGRKINPE